MRQERVLIICGNPHDQAGRCLVQGQVDWQWYWHLRPSTLQQLSQSIIYPAQYSPGPGKASHVEADECHRGSRKQHGGCIHLKVILEQNTNSNLTTARAATRNRDGCDSSSGSSNNSNTTAVADTKRGLHEALDCTVLAAAALTAYGGCTHRPVGLAPAAYLAEDHLYASFNKKEAAAKPVHQENSHHSGAHIHSLQPGAAVQGGSSSSSHAAQGTATKLWQKGSWSCSFAGGCCW